MIVEDDLATRGALKRIFERRGWRVTGVGTVAEGLASLDRRPDWLILDLALPDGDGTEVLRQIRKSAMPTQVIICTGVGESNRLAAAIELRPALVARKPIDIFAVLTLVGAADTK